MLEFLILLTGNYNFFNLLTIVLCLGLLDDRAFGAVSMPQSRKSPPAGWRVVIAAMALLGVLQIHQTLGRTGVSGWETSLLRVVAPLQLVNSYGLFAVMTTHRDELVVEGSADGVEWQELPFKFKPQRLDAAPRWAAPFQPRLDWQMWFAALTSREGGTLVRQFRRPAIEWCARCTRCSIRRPSPRKPPHLIRVLRYRYQFTTAGAAEQTGAWWRRQYVGVWYPPARLSADADPVGTLRRERVSQISATAPTRLVALRAPRNARRRVCSQSRNTSRLCSPR